MNQRRLKRTMTAAVLTIAAASSVVLGTAGSSSAAPSSAQGVQFVRSFPTIDVCRAVAQISTAIEGRTYWCDGVYLFRLV
ncbi:hypothetical protein [Streptomyces sp. NRRL WC-3618]|uniref:hypothetical protein n=1 Tax=Streptomyces sp. NRRL WC-3618 TaxID=1519490 RepID=UPI000B2051C9|nr:hypothetical protein [Streptomyces sp. NRRL WC-3618]